uniref:Ephrin RBD domain-containing protein n=1 Tax=Oryzias sinensis TaxID=183150 RepID=A0A8C7WWG5_9TELE
SPVLLRLTCPPEAHLFSSPCRFVPGQGVVLYPQIGDKLDIVCPRVDGGVSDGVEFYKVYMVPREQLESCTITKADTPLLNCVKPDQDVKFTLKFQEFSPNLWGLEFFKGKDYYIICEYGHASSSSSSSVVRSQNVLGGGALLNWCHPERKLGWVFETAPRSSVRPSPGLGGGRPPQLLILSGSVLPLRTAEEGG